MSTVDERKVGFTGTRHGMTPEQADEFRSWIKAIQPTEFHHGDCVGADNQAATIVREVMGRTCLIHSHPPLEKMHRAFNSHVDIIHPAKEYHARNRDIVDATGQTIGAPKDPAPETPYHPLPKPNGGTWYTLGYAERRGKARRIMWPNGSSSASFPGEDTDAKGMTMRVLIYEVLTQFIIWLGKLRTKVTAGMVMQRKHGRTFYASNCEAAECCDCGLVHVHYPLHGEEVREQHFRLVPQRPRDYQYKLRLACDPPSVFVDESALDPWTGKPR